MQELVFLLVLMVMTGLGVRLLLMQLDRRQRRLPGPALRIPRFSKLALPHLRLPGLKRPGRQRRLRRVPRSAAYEPVYDYEDDEEEDDLDGFATARSPFGASIASFQSSAAPAPDLPYEEDEDADALPVSRIDFFAETPATPRSASLHIVPAQTDTGALEVEENAYEEPEPAVVEAPEEEPLGPHDIMSFFEKPAAMTQLPETLREAIEPVSASELLAEAREISNLIRSRRHSA
jgi:hypothetical protein